MTLRHHKVYLYRFYLHVPGGLRVLLKTHPPSEHTEDAACHVTHLLSLTSHPFYAPPPNIRTNRSPYVISGSHAK